LLYGIYNWVQRGGIKTDRALGIRWLIKPGILATCVGIGLWNGVVWRRSGRKGRGIGVESD
jgi:hypothetical protein